MKEQPGQVYGVEGAEGGALADSFQSIRADQSFYINADRQLVISFDQYEVAPGYMGVREFVIPTEVVSDLLVSRHYAN